VLANAAIISRGNVIALRAENMKYIGGAKLGSLNTEL
jgi:hypothetical protein